MTWLSCVLAFLTLLGLGQALYGWFLAVRFAAAPWPPPRQRTPVTVLKPLYGDEPLLEQALASHCQQNGWPCQIVFGVQNPADPALAVVERVRARFPDADIARGGEPRRPRAEPQDRQPDQHAAGREARHSGHRRFRPACRARTIWTHRRRAGAARAAGWPPPSMPACRPAPGSPARSAPRRSRITSCPARCWRAPWVGRTAWVPRWRCGAIRWRASAGWRRW